MPANPSSKSPRLSLIAALDEARGIGQQGQLLCHVPEDLAHFKRHTQGHAVVMGRATWESLPERFRPLPGRRNVVLSRQAGFEAPGAQVYPDWPSAWAALANETDVFVIGGGQLYAQLLPLADRLVLTHLAGCFSADTWFPTWNETHWQEVAADSSGWQTSEGAEPPGQRFRWASYLRVRPLEEGVAKP
jgi:dihydrofolate reductase